MSPHRLTYELLLISFSIANGVNAAGIQNLSFLPLNRESSDGRLWNRALDAKFYGRGKEFSPTEWSELLGDCQAITDIPATCFYDDLLLNPNARVVLTRRPFDKWYPSIKSTVFFFFLAPSSALLRLFIDTLARLDTNTSIVLPFGKKVMPFIGGNVSKEECRKLYERHYEKIKEMVPKERLLEYEVKEGWGPLCEFLGVEAPEWEFPRVNDTEWFRQKIWEMMWETAWKAGVELARGVVAVAFVAGLVLLVAIGWEWGHDKGYVEGQPHSTLSSVRLVRG